MFYLGDKKIEGTLALSPMAAFSDSPYRKICRRKGAAFSFTEFISAEALIRGNKKTLAMFRFVEEERPIIFQIFGNNVHSIVEAGRRAEALGPDALDLNMGCSVRKVAQSGSGAALLKDLHCSRNILSELVKAVSIPVTAKIRIGWDNANLNYLEVARMLEDTGVSMISVHGRTRAQAYKGLANWDAIGEIKNAVKIPVLGNGDIKTFEEAHKKRETYGLDGVLIGRAAIGNPWIFEGRKKRDLCRREFTESVLGHFRDMCNFYPSGMLLFRKHVARYFSGFDGSKEWKMRLQFSRSIDEFEAICEEFCLDEKLDLTVSEEENFLMEPFSSRIA